MTLTLTFASLLHGNKEKDDANEGFSIIDDTFRQASDLESNSTATSEIPTEAEEPLMLA